MAFKDVIGLYHFILVASFVIFLSCDLELDKVDLDALGNSRIDEIKPLHMAVFRASCATGIFASLIYLTLHPSPLCVTVQLRDGTKTIAPLLHFERYSMFTVWSWTLKGVYFALSAYISFAVHTKNIESASDDPLNPLLTLPELYQPSPLLSLTVWVLFEVCFPIAFIVTTIVTFVLIPHALRNKMPTANFFNFLPVIMHNANVVSMAIEIVINRIPFAVWHFPFIIFYGMSYSVFSWIWYHRYGYYFYFFLDYSKPVAIRWYCGLMIVVTIFFFMGYCTSQLMNSYNSVLPSLMILAVTGLILKVSP